MDFNLLKTKAKELGIEDIEIYVNSNSLTSIKLHNGILEDNKSNSSNEISVRGIYNNKIASVYVENDDDSEIDFILSSIIEEASIIEKNDPIFMYPGDLEYPIIDNSNIKEEEFTFDNVVNILKKLHEYCMNYSNLVISTDTTYAYEEECITINNTKGLSCKKEIKELVIAVAVYVKLDNQTKQTFTLLRPKDIKDIDYKSIDENIDMLIKSLNAKSIESSAYPVIIKASEMSKILSRFSSIFCADNIINNMSVLKDKLDTKVFSDKITIIDDGMNEHAIIKNNFDDEGVCNKRTVVVDKGVLKTYLHNLSTANHFNTTSTGNGYKQNGKISCMADNMYIEDTNTTLDELIKSVDNGIYITETMGHHAGINPVSATFSLQASGFKIENGKITEPLTLIIISGNIIEQLNNIEGIANDYHYSNTFTSGSIYFKNMSVSGK